MVLNVKKTWYYHCYVIVQQELGGKMRKYTQLLNRNKLKINIQCMQIWKREKYKKI